MLPGWHVLGHQSVHFAQQLHVSVVNQWVSSFVVVAATCVHYLVISQQEWISLIWDYLLKSVQYPVTEKRSGHLSWTHYQGDLLP